MLEFRVLGPLEVCRDGQPIALPGIASRRLLGALALRSGEWVSVERLIDEVWGERPPAAARKALQMHVSRLRQAFAAVDPAAASLLEGGAAGYRLAVDVDQVDARRFSGLVEQGRRSFEIAEFERAREFLTDAVGLWSGEPLAGLERDGRPDPELARLRELRIEALEERIDADLRLGRHAALIGELRHLIAEHPYRERLHGLLMLALYRSGQQADALEVYRSARAALVEQLGIEPGPRLRELHQAVLAQAPHLEMTLASGDGRAAPPVAPTALIGREAACREVAELVARPDVRLVTLVGAGGIGKTRLALEVASTARGRCAWVELAGVSRAEDVGGALVHALGIESGAGEGPEAALIRALADEQLLLVVDNFEHVLASAVLLRRIVSAAPGVTVLATSREPLDLAGEHRYPLAPLELSDGVELFRRAAARRATDSGPTTVLETICRRLDGLPLAIELAASRMELFSPEDLAARLDDVLSALGTGPRDVPDRQRTLRTTIEWSYRLLDAEQRDAFAAFAAFPDDADLTAAVVVTGASWDTLQALISKHLLERAGRSRLRMLDTIRAFAVERTGDEARRRHLAHFLELATASRPHLFTRSEPEWLGRLDAERHNLRAALAWSCEHEPALALRLAAALERYFGIRGPEAEAQRWLERALVAAGDDAPQADRADAEISLAFNLSNQFKAGDAAARHGLALAEAANDRALQARAELALALERFVNVDLAGARPHAREALRHAQAVADPVLAAYAHRLLASCLPSDAARPHFDLAVRGFREIGNRWHEAMMYSDRAYSAIVEQRYTDALELLEQALALLDDDHPRVRMSVYGNLGLAKLLTGNARGATEAFRVQLALAASRNDTGHAPEGLGGLAAVAAEHGDHERCARLLGCALSIGRVGEPALVAELERRFYEPARRALEPASWDVHESGGAALTIKQAVEELS